MESILEATFTVFPQISYWGFWAPTTPAITGPCARPIGGGGNERKELKNRWNRQYWCDGDDVQLLGIIIHTHTYMLYNKSSMIPTCYIITLLWSYHCRVICSVQTYQHAVWSSGSSPYWWSLTRPPSPAQTPRAELNSIPSCLSPVESGRKSNIVRLSLFYQRAHWRRRVQLRKSVN